MRRAIAAVLVTAITVFVPATTAQAKQPPVKVKTLWPLCTIVLGTGVCIPP